MNTLGTLTAENKEFYERALLKRLTPNLVFTKYGQKKSAPKNEGDTVNFRRFNSLPISTTPLQEGVTPTGDDITVTTVKATVTQFGRFATITDKLDLMGIDPVVTETVQVQGEQAGMTIDTVSRNEIVNGTNVQYSGGRANTDALTAADVLTSTDVKKAVRTLRKANAKPKEGKFFIGVVDPDVAYDLMSDPLWQDVSKYNGGTAIMEGEIGKLHGVRFIETTNTNTHENAGGVMVYDTMIIGADAYGIVDISGSSKPEVIVKPLGSGDDPLNQRSTCGWKCLFTAKRLQELAMVRIESAVSA